MGGHSRKSEKNSFLLQDLDVPTVAAAGPGSDVIEGGYDIRTIQELLGHSDVKTTMIYTHVLNRGPSGVRSPADVL